MKKIFKKLINNPYFKISLETFNRADLSMDTAAIAYYSLLSLFPAIIILATILPLFGLTTQNVMHFLDLNVPATITNVLFPMIKSILQHPGVGTVSITILFALWSLSKVVASIRKAQNTIYDIEVKQNTLLGRAISLIWMIFLIGCMGTLVIIASIGSNLLETLPLPAEIVKDIDIIKSAAVPTGLFIGLTLFNFVIPAIKPRFKWVLVGSLVQVGGMLLLAKGFGLYINFAGRSYSFYQAVGSVIILMLWLNLIATIVLFGTMVTSVLNQIWPSKSRWLYKINQTLNRTEYQEKPSKAPELDEEINS